MIAVIFEVVPAPGRKEEYLDLAAALRPELDVARAARDIALALAFAHDTGVIHRDIKPQNILYDESDTAILTDFGIARVVAGYVSTTGKQLVLGTPHYISPEQARGRNGVFADYRLRVASVLRDYGMSERAEAPADSREAHKG